MRPIQDTAQFRQGEIDAKAGRLFDPPAGNYARACYLAGFNTGRQSPMATQATDGERRIIRLMGGTDA